MSWQNSTAVFEEAKVDDKPIDDPLEFQQQKASEEEAKRLIQIKKNTDPIVNIERQRYIAIASQFTSSILNHKFDDIVNNMLTEDFQGFLFDSSGSTASIKHCQSPEDFRNLFNGLKIIERNLRQNNVDDDAKVVFQISDCKIQYENNESFVYGLTHEVFTISDGKISKYRIIFANKPKSQNQQGDFLEATRKEKILAKIKEINYALADQPDFLKMASYFHDTIEFKIWRWDDQKYFVFNKENFASRYQELEEKMRIESIIPLKVGSVKELTVGLYAYHLREKTSGKKFIWISKIIFTIDNDLNIVKASQLGDIIPKEEYTTPTEVYSKQELRQTVKTIFKDTNVSLDYLYHGYVDFECNFYSLGPSLILRQDYLSLKKIDVNAMKKMKEEVAVESIQLVDCFVDEQDPVYDVVLVMNSAQVVVHRSEYPHKDKVINFFNAAKISFEHGKIVKIIRFVADVPEPMPSPFEDKNFADLNFHKNQLQV